MTPYAYTPESLKVLFTEQQLQNRIEELAEEMNHLYRDTEVLIMICILKGGFMFASDLARKLNIPCQIEFVRLSSYGDGQKTTGTVKPVDLTLPRLSNRDVLLVEDIVDTGLTLNFFMEYLESLHTPKSLRLAVLLDKQEARQRPVKTDFIGFEVGNEYVVGYGLDDQGYYRNLPYIAHFTDTDSQ